MTLEYNIINPNQFLFYTKFIIIDECKNTIKINSFTFIIAKRVDAEKYNFRKS